MYCPGCGMKYPPNMLPWHQLSPNGGAWRCSSCQLQKKPDAYCIACGSALNPSLGYCLPCVTGPLQNMPSFSVPPPSKMIIVKKQMPDPGLSIKFDGVDFGGFHPVMQEPVPEAVPCKRCQRNVDGQPITGLCSWCREEWSFAGNQENWPKAVKKFTFERFMKTAPGSFRPLIDAACRGRQVVLRPGDRCAWCQAVVQTRPMFQFTFVGCLC